MITVFFAEVAIIAGWWTAEIGRQPWIVYDVLRTADGVSPTLSGDRRRCLAGDVHRAVRDPASSCSSTCSTDRSSTGPSRSTTSRRSTAPRCRTRSATSSAAAARGRRAESDMTLNSSIWFVLFVVIIAGYLILDGFDMGVGILHVPSPRTTTSGARCSTASARSGTATRSGWSWRAACCSRVFPLVYASLFSGFYLALMLVLLVMILRTVAIEFRSKRPSPRWRSIWDFVFCARVAGAGAAAGGGLRQRHSGRADRRAAATCRSPSSTC